MSCYPCPDDNTDDSCLRTHRQTTPMFPPAWGASPELSGHSHHFYHHYEARNGYTAPSTPFSAPPFPALNHDLMGTRPTDYSRGTPPQLHRTISPAALCPDRSFSRPDEEHLTYFFNPQGFPALAHCAPQAQSIDSSRHSSWSTASGQRETSPIDTNISSISSCSPSIAPGALIANISTDARALNVNSLGGGGWCAGRQQQQQQQQQLSSYGNGMSQSLSAQRELQMESGITMKDIQWSPDPAPVEDHTFDVDDPVSRPGTQFTLNDPAGIPAIDPDLDLDAEGEPDEDYTGEEFTDRTMVEDDPDSNGSDSDFRPTSSSQRGGPRRVTAPRTTRNNKSVTFPSPTMGGRVSKSSIAANASSRRGHKGKKEKPSIKGKAEEVVNKAIAQSRNPQPFTCPMTPYGCKQKFTTKNEWKRHIISLHLFLGLWRCDLCPDMASRPNDFNRKDLFVQHLRRMHYRDRPSSEKSKDGKKKGSTPKRGKQKATAEQTPAALSAEPNPSNEELEKICQRCFHQLREEPKHTYCAFCGQHFHDNNSLEDWLEHVAKHLSDSAEHEQSSVVSSPAMAASTSAGVSVGQNGRSWADDDVFLEWLRNNKLVESDSKQWTMKDREIVIQDAQSFISAGTQVRRHHNLPDGEHAHNEQDAMGDADEDDDV